MRSERLLHDRRQLAPPLRILLIDEQCLSSGRNVRQRIVDLVAQTIGKVVESLQFGGLDCRSKISVAVERRGGWRRRNVGNTLHSQRPLPSLALRARVRPARPFPYRAA